MINRARLAALLCACLLLAALPAFAQELPPEIAAIIPAHAQGHHPMNEGAPQVIKQVANAPSAARDFPTAARQVLGGVPAEALLGSFGSYIGGGFTISFDQLPEELRDYILIRLAKGPVFDEADGGLWYYTMAVDSFHLPDTEWYLWFFHSLDYDGTTVHGIRTSLTTGIYSDESKLAAYTPTLGFPIEGDVIARGSLYQLIALPVYNLKDLGITNGNYELTEEDHASILRQAIAASNPVYLPPPPKN